MAADRSSEILTAVEALRSSVSGLQETLSLRLGTIENAIAALAERTGAVEERLGAVDRKVSGMARKLLTPSELIALGIADARSAGAGLGEPTAYARAAKGSE